MIASCYPHNVAKLPTIGFFPALPLGRELELGEWMVGTPPDEVAWHSSRFKELVSTLLTSFAQNDSGERFIGGALLWRKPSGFDGEPPTREEFSAIQAAVRFAALGCNDLLRRDDPNSAHHVVTSENAALHVQPIDLENGYITHVREGFLKRVLGGGWRIGEHPPPLADGTIPILGQLPVSNILAKAVFEAHLKGDTEEVRRLGVAIEWHAAALSNAVAVTWQQRIIALKTGFEALLDASNSREGARRLRALFEEAAKPHVDLLPSPNLLWSPREKTDLPRHWNKRPELWSELEDWFMTLSDARNKVIHEGRVTVMEYKAPPQRPLSRYAGQLFWKGERILREAIKARLGTNVLLCGPLKQREIYRPLVEQLRAQAAQASGAPPPQDKPSNAPPGRDLRALLSELRCARANEVEIGWVSGGGSATLECAVEMAKAAGWVAKGAGIEVRISESEKQMLEDAGAELELPGHITLCD